MPKPNFWRLKRKANDNAKPSVQNPPKISQKTISSFFGANHKPTNLNAEDQEELPNSSGFSEAPKRPKLDLDSNTSKPPVKISVEALSKLQSFSASERNGDDERTQNGSGSDRPVEVKQRIYTIKDNDITEDRTLEDNVGLNSDEEVSKLNSLGLDTFRAHHQSTARAAHAKPSGKVKYTPLEQQVMELWKQHPGILLIVECGYKYRFFGEDAEVASRELNIFAYPDHNFMTASIPVHRLHAHVSRLVEKGHKVGLVKQIETAALKAVSETKSTLFSRKLEQIFTRATLIGEDLEKMEKQNIQLDEGLPAAHIFCLNEKLVENKYIHLGWVAVNPSTGESIYDSCEDSPSREKLYKYLQLINPAEILMPIDISADSERLLNHFNARLERVPTEQFDEANALTRVSSNFVSQGGETESALLEKLMEIPPLVLTCLSALQNHLEEFGLQKAIRLNGLQSLSIGSKFVSLDASTIQNLELFRSGTGSVHGSLFWALNHTKTKFGARLLHQWIAQPTQDIKALEERQDSITELLGADGVFVSTLTTLLASLPDLERGLTTILHNKCTPMHYLNVVETLCRMRSELSSLMLCVKRDIRTPLLQQLISNSVDVLEDVQSYRDNINTAAAKEGDKTKLLKNFSAFPNVVRLMDDIDTTTSSLDNLRPEIARKLSLMSVNYTCVSGQEYLVEVRNTMAKSVPMNWRKISSTKQVSRYRPAAVESLLSELQRLREKLRIECNRAWVGLLQDFSQHYFQYKQAVQNVAILDVLLSLAHIAVQEGYSRPKLVESETARVIIKRGRHPVVPLLFPSANQFVPNDTNLDSAGECCMVLSGPNMGGKSCYIRQVALITLMAHIGSYVPAEYAEISLLASIHTRMGARDELFQGRSTLMVELAETAAILQNVSRRSLVLLDELGRGTGSCDGSAIACATLQHIVQEVQCLTLFVTHYPPVMDTATELCGKARNYHMAFLLHDQEEEEVLTFLYEVVEGAADRSYGINVARLANLYKQILQRASSVAGSLESQAKSKKELRKSFLSAWKA